MKTFWTRRRSIFAIVLLAALLRAWAAWQLPLDFDEPVYLQAGFDYARMLEAGDLNRVIDYRVNEEHPPLIKLLYSLTVLVQGEHPDWNTALFLSRGISALFGTLAVWALALFNPLAGFFLAIQTLVVKFTSQAYLEGLPLFTSIVAVLAMLHSRAPRDRWFWLSAAALGATAAGKFSYFPVLFVVLFVFWQRRYPAANLLALAGAAGLAFLALDPALWHDPAGRLAQALSFHASYSQSAHVQQAGYPWYQPFLWVSRSWGYYWHPDVILYLGLDGGIAILAVLGLKRDWEQARWVVVWLAAGMLTLLVWPTKWPQYALVVLPAICISASIAAGWIYNRIREEDMYWNWIEGMFPHPSRAWSLLVVAVVALVLVGQIANTINQAVQRRGWWHLTTSNTVMPSNTIYQVIRLPDGRMLLGTDHGAVFFTLSEDTGLPASWEVLTPDNSSLPGDRILALVQDSQGGLWFGTQAGLAHLSGGQWQTYHAQDFGLAGEQVQALELGGEGRVWVGTNAGLAGYDGRTWRAYTHANSALPDDFILSLAVEPGQDGDVVWVGGRMGLSRLDSSQDSWSSLSPSGSGQNSGGVSDLLLDSQDHLWVATLGSGLNLWNGEAWDEYRVSNSKIPSNTVTRVGETEPGVVWVSTAIPNQAGGVLSRVTGVDWKNYLPNNSGFSGAEPLSFTLDPRGRLWIGTRTAGVDIYQTQK